MPFYFPTGGSGSSVEGQVAVILLDANEDVPENTPVGTIIARKTS